MLCVMSMVSKLGHRNDKCVFGNFNFGVVMTMTERMTDFAARDKNEQ